MLIQKVDNKDIIDNQYDVNDLKEQELYLNYLIIGDEKFKKISNNENNKNDEQSIPFTNEIFLENKIKSKTKKDKNITQTKNLIRLCNGIIESSVPKILKKDINGYSNFQNTYLLNNIEEFLGDDDDQDVFGVFDSISNSFSPLMTLIILTIISPFIFYWNKDLLKLLTLFISGADEMKTESESKKEVKKIIINGPNYDNYFKNENIESNILNETVELKNS